MTPDTYVLTKYGVFGSVPHFGTEAFQWAFAIGKDVATFPTTFA